ncbi:MAG: TonB-dependent receptor domain-containing protein, partial [Chloroflexota bacterium]
FSREQSTVLDLILAGGGGTINLVNDRANLNAKHTNAYMYSFINPLNNLTFTLGVSVDFYDSKNAAVAPDQKQINPKVGMVWNPLPGTTVRAAAFRSLTRALITSQTLEPTQVAGFNQFYDDFESTEAWRYGAAVNQKFSRTVFGGIEYSHHDCASVVTEKEVEHIRMNDRRVHSPWFRDEQGEQTVGDRLTQRRKSC